MVKRIAKQPGHARPLARALWGVGLLGGAAIAVWLMRARPQDAPVPTWLMASGAGEEDPGAAIDLIRPPQVPPWRDRGP